MKTTDDYCPYGDQGGVTWRQSARTASSDPYDVLLVDRFFWGGNGGPSEG